MSLPSKTPVLFDPENWNQNYRELLMQIAINRVNDYQVAEDLVQDTFMAAWKSKDRFRGDCSEKTFLCGILKNKIIDFYRARGRRPTVVASQIGDDDADDKYDWLDNRPDGHEDQNPDMALQKADFLNQLETAVEKLPEKMGQAFRMWFMKGMSTREVTEKLNITEGNLWVSIHRAKKLLKAELSSEWEGASLTFSP